MKLDEKFIERVKADHVARNVHSLTSENVIARLRMELGQQDEEREFVRAHQMLNGLIEDPNDPLLGDTSEIDRELMRHI